MNTHSHTRSNRSEFSAKREMSTTRSSQPAKGGLWKLLVTAVILLLGLLACVEFFGDGDNGFTTSTIQQTIVQ